MSIYQQSKTAAARIEAARAPEVSLAVLFLGVTGPTIAFLLFIKTPLILPSLSLISLMIAGLVALAAWITRANREGGILLSGTCPAHTPLSGSQPECSAIQCKWSS
jgi:hypothetical protein